MAQTTKKIRAVLIDIQNEHKRILKKIGPEDPYLGDTTIGIFEALKAHFLLIEFFAKSGEGVGGIGPKDINLLHSALNRQFLEFGGTPRWNNRLEVCATLMYGLIKNHPFYDANKRTAFLVSLLHLQKIGRTPTISHKEYEDFTVNIAENNLTNYPKWHDIRLPSPDKEITIMTNFLRRSTREIDLRTKFITYNELNRIIGKHGLILENPNKNKIDVMRIKENDGVTPLKSPRRVAHIGFHGWSKQASKKDIHIVRSAAELDISHGYDSQAFFEGAEDPLTLIKKYEEPLRRLAYR